MYIKKIMSIIIMVTMLLVSYAISVNADDKVTIKVDGNASDWTSVAAVASNISNAHVKSLKVINGEKVLYFCIEGNTIQEDPSYGLFLNTDNNDSTGFQSEDWEKSGFDFYIENGILYKYVGDGFEWEWKEVASVEVAASDSAMEIVVPAVNIGELNAGSIIGVAYNSISGDWAPSEFIPAKGSDTSMYTIKNAEMAAAGSTPTTTPEPAGVPAAVPVNFDDAGQIPGWAKEAVDTLSAKGIVAGANNKFNPNTNVSRAEFVKLLVSVADIFDQNSDVNFADVKKGDWFYGYVASAFKKGIITGKNNGRFAPYDPVTRQDMAVMLSKALTAVYGKTPDNSDAISTFVDKGDIAGYAKEGVATAVKYRLMEGVGNKQFMPKGIVTRAQAAKAIYMLLTACTQQTAQTADSQGIYHKVLKPWDKITNYVCYYSKFKPELTYFDVAIIEAREMTREEVQKLKASGTYVIAYVTVGERDGALEKGNGKGPGGYASYYIDDGKGEPSQNQVWKSYYVNAGDPSWQDEVINKFAKAAIEDKGCDGVFLDTVDTAEMFPETAVGMVELIKKLHEKYPDKKIVNNRGMFVLPKVAQYISGMMYESFSHDYDFEKNEPVILGEEDLRYTGYIAVNKINAYRKENNFQVFCLDYADPNDKAELQKIYDRAWEYDFIPYASNIYLDKVYIHNIIPKSQRGAKKFTGEASKPIGPASTDAKNLALASNGTIAATDSNFPEYGPKALNDGYRFEENMFWAEVAWASAETSQDHWAMFTFDKEKEVKEIKIYWAKGDSMYMTPKQLKVQVQVEDMWIDIKEITNLAANTDVSVIKLDEPVKAKQVRILQPAGEGAEERPDLMWAFEVEMY